MAKNRNKKQFKRGALPINEIYFFCDNCSAIKPSIKHRVTLTSDGIEIVRDICADCGVEQEIEGVGPSRIETFRIRSDETRQNRNQKG